MKNLLNILIVVTVLGFVIGCGSCVVNFTSCQADYRPGYYRSGINDCERATGVAGGIAFLVGMLSLCGSAVVTIVRNKRRGFHE